MRNRKEQPAYKLGLKYLEQNEGMTALQLTEALGIASRNVYHYIKLWREDGLIKIVGWEQRKQGHSAIYGFGKRDVNKPKPKTDAENSATYRKKFGVLLNIKKRMAYKNKSIEQTE